jgi:hypothetical protein
LGVEIVELSLHLSAPLIVLDADFAIGV